MSRGEYPKSYEKSDLAKIVHDHVIDYGKDKNKINQIIGLYDLVFSLQHQIEKNRIENDFRELIRKFKGYQNFIIFCFNKIKSLMIELKIRDDILFTNDNIYRTHYKIIKFYLDYYKLV